MKQKSIYIYIYIHIERERERNERKSEPGIAREQLRTRARYDSTLADYARCGVERFDKARLPQRERRFHGLVNISARIRRYAIRFILIAISRKRLIDANYSCYRNSAGSNRNLMLTQLVVPKRM